MARKVRSGRKNMRRKKNTYRRKTMRRKKNTYRRKTMRRKNMRGQNRMRGGAARPAATPAATLAEQERRWNFGDEVMLNIDIPYNDDSDDKLVKGLKGVVISDFPDKFDRVEVGMFPMVFSEPDMKKIFSGGIKAGMEVGRPNVPINHMDTLENGGPMMIVRYDRDDPSIVSKKFQGSYQITKGYNDPRAQSSSTAVYSTKHSHHKFTLYKKWTSTGDKSWLSQARSAVQGKPPPYWGVCLQGERGGFKVNLSDITSTTLQEDNVRRVYKWGIDKGAKGVAENLSQMGKATWPSIIVDENQYIAEGKIL